MTNEWRPLDPEERTILDRLLEEEFPGRDEVRAQVEGSQVKAWHDFGHCRSLEFRIPSQILLHKDQGSDPLPVEASFTDSDGITVEILLFAKAGYLWAMEFVVYSDKQKRMPEPSDLDVWINPSWL
jgi:hypothetical protein